MALPVSENPTGSSGQPGAAGAVNAARGQAEPLSTGDYIVMFLLFSLPFINLILAFTWGFGGNVNPNRKNFAKAWLVMLLVFLVLGIMFAAVFLLVFREFMPLLDELI